jgi:hypothetical protein
MPGSSRRRTCDDWYVRAPGQHTADDVSNVSDIMAVQQGRAAEAASSLAAGHAGSVREVDRVDVASLSVAEFMERYAVPRVPVIFTAPAAFALTPNHPFGWTAETLRAAAGDVSVVPKKVRRSSLPLWCTWLVAFVPSLAVAACRWCLAPPSGRAWRTPRPRD